LITPATHYLSENEPCLLLTELDVVPKKGAMHRYRSFYVIRGDKVCVHMEDMGLAKKQKADQVRIMGGMVDRVTKRIFIEHSVAELRAIAQQRKKAPLFDKCELAGVNRIRS